MLLLVYAYLGTFSLGGCAGESLSPAMRDRIRDVVPAAAVAQAQRALRRPVAWVRERRLEFSSKKLYQFYISTSWAHRDPSVLLLQKGNRFVEVNCREGLPALREIMQDYRFGRRDFEDRQKLTDFFENVLYLSGVPHGCVLASDAFLKEIEREDPNGVDLWAREAIGGSVFRSLCHDPGLAIDRNDWVAVFNVLAPDGSAEVWRVSGIWDPRSQTNTIEKIERFPLYNRHTFNYLLIGG